MNKYLIELLSLSYTIAYLLGQGDEIATTTIISNLLALGTFVSLFLNHLHNLSATFKSLISQIC